MKPSALSYQYVCSEGDHTLEFLYGHDKQRRKTTLYDQNGLTIEKYFVGLYEKEIEGTTTRHINYITAGDGMTAIVVEEEENGNSETETYFTYKDHLGSIVALTDENGDVMFEQSFDPWGRYRNPSNWSYSNFTESPTWLRGYTGHEHLPHFNLINMNGRIYDPILGRMLSPDNYVQDPTFSQSYNRYSYVWNNPLRYTDPSGEIVWAPIIIGAVAGGFSGWQIGQALGAEGWGMAGYVVGGAAIGALSGGVGNAVATSGGFMANTSAILFSSTVNTMGMSILSGHETDLNISYGFGSYNVSSNEFGYLGKPGNSTIENVGYSFGALANVSDILVGNNPENVELLTNKEGKGHSAIVNEGEKNPNESLISFGPGDPIKKEGWYNPFHRYKGNHEYATDLNHPKTIKDVVRGVNKSILEEYAKWTKSFKYNVYYSSCVNHTARGLTLSGVPVLGIHPSFLRFQIHLRNIGVRPSMFTHFYTN